MQNQSFQTTLFRLSAGLVLAALLFSACSPAPGPAPTVRPSATPLSSPTQPAPAATNPGLIVMDDGQPLPPQVVEHQPRGAEELAPDGQLVLTFDQEMDAGRTAAALKVSAAQGGEVAGEVAWDNLRRMRFSPAKALKTGTLYQASLATTAASAQGVPLAQPFKFDFITTGDLEVSQVSPPDGAQDVDAAAAITVIFNRPVVPLLIAEEQAGLPQPLELTPAVEGQGEWVNTSVYVFRPKTALAGGTLYTAVVRAGLSDAAKSSSLSQDYAWTFSTSLPAVESLAISSGQVNPENGLRNVLLDETFTIRFLQPMDRPSVEAALSLSAAGGSVGLESVWSEDSMQIVITPTARLSLETTYNLRLDQSAQAASGGSLKEGLDWQFTTVPAPEIISTRYAGQESGGEFSPEFWIKFASPMRIDSVKERIVITPKPEKAIEWWYNEWEWSLYSWILKPSTRYEVRFLPGMEDIYGNTIRQEKVLRFTTPAYSPSASLQMPYESPILRAGGPPEAQQVYAEYRNIETLRLALYQLEPLQYAAFLSGKSNAGTYVPAESTRIWQVEERSTADLNQRVLKSFQLSGPDGVPLKPGAYFLTLDSPQVNYYGNIYADYRLLLVADANLTFKSSYDEALAWVTDLESGKPLAGVPVTFYDENFNPVNQGVTDGSGLLKTSIPRPADYYSNRYAMVNGGEHFAFASSAWGSGVSLYDYGAWFGNYSPANQPTAYLYTDRPIYRPGQPVYFKGILRLDDDLNYSLPPNQQAHLKISNYEEPIYEADVPLTGMGSFDGKFTLDSEATLGYYTLEVSLSEDVGNPPLASQTGAIGSVTFNVAEYRKPEYQVSVTAEPANVLAGGQFTGQLQADYYSGGAVSGAELVWTLLAENFYFQPPDEYSAYNFSDYQEDINRYFSEESNAVVVAEGKGQTDSSGAFSQTLPAEPGESGESRTLTWEVTLADLAQTSVSGRAQVVAHRSMVYPGAKPKSYVGKAGEEQTFELVALDWDGKPLAGQTLTVKIVERRWYSVQEQDASGRVSWKSSSEEIPVSEQEVRTDGRGLATASFTPPNGGIFKAEVTGLDSRGNPGKTAAYMWVAGDEFVPWMQTNDRSFDLVADRKVYSPGDKARLLIASPFQGEAYALVTVERGRIRQQEVILLENNSTVYDLPVTADMAPNVYVSVLIIQGVNESNPAPDFRMGVAELKVNTDRQELRVELAASPASAGPGDLVTYSVRTTDLKGKPVSAEVSLSLSDLATLSLLPPNSPPLLDFFYSERTLSVWTSVPIVLGIDSYNMNLKDEVQEGAAMGSGGGKGEGDLGVVAVRQDFPDTAFWDAFVNTDGDGLATVSVRLPDNLTTWRMDARAVTGETRVGQATLDLISSKPLLVRPQTPRFLVAGDQAVLGTAVHNNTDNPLSVVVELEGTGLAINSPLTQSIEIPARQQAYVSWETSVDPEAQRVDLVFSAESADGLQDASRPPQGTLDNQGLPVYRYEAHETVGTSGQMSGEGTLVEAISLPTSMQAGSGELRIKVSPSLAAGMTDGLSYLAHYPYECIEQTISRFLPNVMTARALKDAGVSNPQLEAELQTEVDTALQRLYNWQNADGGWGWWRNDKSDPLTSAYVVMGLMEAKTSGYSVNQDVINRGLAFLQTQVIPITGLVDPEKVNRQAFILFVLALAGQPDVSSTVQLYEQRERMALYAQAFLTRALYEIDPQDPRLETLKANFASQAILSATGTHWEEKQYDRWNWNTDTRTTAIILTALSQVAVDSPLNANAVRWLMSSRTNGHWQGTQETAWTLMGLADWMTASGELEANYKFGVALNNVQLGSGEATRETLRDSLELKVDIAEMLQDQANRLAFGRDGGPGNLYYTAHLDVSLPVEAVEPLEQGIIVSRSYYRLDDPETPVTNAKQGELLLVRLTVVALNSLHYVVVDDPLPAGLEAVDQSLNTSPQSVEVPRQTLTMDDLLWRGWGWWAFSHVQRKDEKVVLSADYLPAGTYIYTYLVRAGTVGEFRTIPTTAQEFYFPEVYGRGAGGLFTVEP